MQIQRNAMAYILIGEKNDTRNYFDVYICLLQVCSTWIYIGQYTVATVRNIFLHEILEEGNFAQVTGAAFTT